MNKACAELNGVSREDTLGKGLEEIVPDLVDVLTPIFDNVYLHNEPTKNTLVEGKTPASDKLRYWMASYQPLALTNGKTGLLVTAEEVTQRIFAVESAATNKKLLTDVLNSLFTFVGLLDADGFLIDANKAPLDAAGIALDDVKGKLFWDCFWWTYSVDSREKIRQAVKTVQQGTPVRFDIDVRVSGGFLTVDFMMEGLKDEHENLTHIIPSAIDISKRKQTELELQLSQARFKNVTDRTVDGLVAFDRDGTIRFVNRRFQQLVHSEVQTNVNDLRTYFKDATVIDRFTSLVKYTDQNDIDYTVHTDKIDTERDICVLYPSLKSVEVAFSPLLDGGEILFLATVADVSALHNANQALEVALKEKTILLNEVHHRVKNNLQVMSSLLSLQANSNNTNETTKEALLDSQRRLKSMALVHQLLYERDDFTYTNVQQFTQKLIQLLQDSMVNGADVKVETYFPSNPITLSLDQTVPFGFLLTELITNAFKHAFDKDQLGQPTITISIQHQDTDIVVAVADNGKGMKTDSSNIVNSLGTELIYVFSKQLQADLCTVSEKGVTHTFRFTKHLGVSRSI